MRLRDASAIALPALVGSTFFCPEAGGQIQPDGYTCPPNILRTHNNSTDITVRSVTCALPTSFAHWYDLSIDPDLSGSYAHLKCVDFSIWSSSNPFDQEIFVRVYRDNTPLSRSDQCGNAGERGPDLASLVLLWETTILLPSSAEGVDSLTIPRPDGDRSVLIGDFSWGVLVTPDSAIFIEVGHLGEARTRFGCNDQGEAGDVYQGAEVTWIKAPSCDGGNCTGVDWMKHSEWYPTGNRDYVMQAHFGAPECSCPPPLPPCSTDITGTNDQPDGWTNVPDLLALLDSWGSLSPPRPIGDVAPLPNGDNIVNVPDLLEMLREWGPCPDPQDVCTEIMRDSQAVARVSEGSHAFDLDATLDGPNRPSTNEIIGPTTCGWYDYGINALPGGFRYGDAFGIDALTGQVGGDIWFLYNATVTGTVVITTQSACGPGEISDTLLEVYPGSFRNRGCPTYWWQLTDCNDSSTTGCGDHARIELPVTQDAFYLIRIGGKFGDTGSGVLSIQPQ